MTLSVIVLRLMDTLSKLTLLLPPLPLSMETHLADKLPDLVREVGEGEAKVLSLDFEASLVALPFGVSSSVHCPHEDLSKFTM